MFPSSGEEKEIHALLGSLERANLNHWTGLDWITELRLALSKGPNRVCVFLPKPEDENRPGFRNVVFSNYLESQMTDEAHTPSDSEL
jgi:hypothetical protein